MDEKSNVRMSGNLPNATGGFEFSEEDMAAAQSIGISLPPSAIACIDVAIQAANQSALLSIGAGYALMSAKSQLSHGEFGEHVEKRGLSRQRAAELMSFARLYTATSPEKRGLLIAIGKSKALLLTSADPEVIDDVLNDPEAGLESLSVRGLRQRIVELEKRHENDKTALDNAAKREAVLIGKKRLTHFAHFTEEVRAETMALQREAELPLDGLLALFERATLSYDGSHEAKLRVDHLWLAANAILARAADAVAHLRENAPDVLPDRLQSDHYLTPEEAAEWRRLGLEIQSDYEARKYIREQERAAEQPPKRGRPKGSKNKPGGVA